MFYSSYATLAVAAVMSLKSVLAAPMPMEAKIGDGDHKAKVVETMPVVNQKLKNMKAVINLPDAQAKAHPATVKAFGGNANVAEIRKNINTLDSSKIMIPHTDAEPILTQGGTWPNGHIKFGSAFYSSDKNTRAGTIIHEASHAKLNTVDHFKADGKPGGKGDPYVGYKDSHMDHLNAHHSDQMHHNADAYRVFADECPHVARRALSEPHPVIRRELVRRAAKACAWKPKSKVATTKATDKKAAVSKSKGSQKSVGAKMPLSVAKSASKSHKVAKSVKAAKKPVQHPKAAKVAHKLSAKKPIVQRPVAKSAKVAAKSVHHSKGLVKPVQRSSAKGASKKATHKGK